MNRFITIPLLAISLLLAPCAQAEAQTSAPLEAARAALKTNDLAKAAELLGPLTGADATEAAAFHLLSQVRLAEKKAKDSVELAERATVLDATKPAYFSQLGIALSQRMGEVNFMQQAMLAGKLRKAFAKAVELDPNDVAGLAGLARFYTNAPEIAGGSVAKAKEFAVRVERLDPVLGAGELGNIAEHEERYAEALGYYEKAAKLKPTSAGAQTLCGRVLVKLGRKEEARARFEAALKISPTFEAARKGLAQVGATAP